MVQMTSRLGKRKFAIGNFVVPMAVNVENEDVTGLEDIVELEEEKVRCLSQEERSLADPLVGSRDCMRVDYMVKSAPKILEWNKHLMRQEIQMSQTVLCVEAVKCVEETFSTVLHSVALTGQFLTTSTRLSSVMKESATILKYPLRDIDIWLTIPFAIFCSGILHISNVSASTSNSKSVRLLAAAKILFMHVVQGGLNDVIHRSRNAGVALDEMTLNFIKSMRASENFIATVQEWAHFALKRKERNRFAHPWSDLDADEKRVYLQDLDRVLEDRFTLNFRGVGHLAKLALLTEDAEKGAGEKNRNLMTASKFMELIDKSETEFDKRVEAQSAKETADDDALEAGQFHTLAFEFE